MRFHDIRRASVRHRQLSAPETLETRDAWTMCPADAVRGSVSHWRAMNDWVDRNESRRYTSSVGLSVQFGAEWLSSFT